MAIGDNHLLPTEVVCRETKAIEELSAHTDLLYEVKTSLLEAVKMTKSAALHHLRVRLEPTILVNDKIAPKRFFYRRILPILSEFGIEKTIKEGQNIIEVTIDAFFNTEELKKARDKANSLLSSRTAGRAAGTAAINLPSIAIEHTTNSNGSQDARSNANQNFHHGELSRKLSSASHLFRDKSSRFSGTLDSSISLFRFRQVFLTNAEQYWIPETHMVPLLLNALTGSALDFYLDPIQGKINRIPEAFMALEKRFDSPHSRAQAQSYLESTTLASIRDAEQCSTAKASELAQQRIDNVVPMCGPAFRDESHKSRWLAHIVRFENWASQCLTQRLTNPQDYGTFIASLNSALTQLSISKPNEQKQNDGSLENQFKTNWFGRQYANPRPKASRYPHFRSQRRTQSQLRALKSRTRCLKCGNLGHWRAECPHKNLSMTEAVQARINSNSVNFTTLTDTIYALALHDDQHADYINQIQDLDNPLPETNKAHFSVTENDPFAHILNSLDVHEIPTDWDTPRHTNNPDENYIETNIVFATPLESNLPVNNIFLNNSPNYQHRPSFLGALVDTGAQRSVIGAAQARAYFKTYNIPPRYLPVKSAYRFGETIVSSIWAIILTIPAPGLPLSMCLHVVPSDIPFLLGLDILERYRLQPLIATQEIHSISEDWRVPLVRERGHLYWRWTSAAQPTPTNLFLSDSRMKISAINNPTNGSQDETHDIRKPTDKHETYKSKQFTETELRRIHLHFGHAGARPLYELLKRSYGRFSASTLHLLNKIVAECSTCIEHAPKSVAFKVRPADRILFNHRLLIDLMWLPVKEVSTHSTRKLPVLHIVDSGTRFNAAAFLSGQSTTDVWNTFIRIWSSMYVGMPNSLLVDQGSVFLSDEWRYACNLNNIELKETGTESHNSLGSGEAYHAYLRRTYLKICKEFPHSPPDVSLAMAVKAINDCTGPKGLCPTLLVFGFLPKLPRPAKSDHVVQTQRYRAAALAREEYEKIVSQERIALAAKKPAPPAASISYSPGDLVYVFREKEKIHTGPHIIASILGKQARLHIGDRNGPRSFNTSQLRPAPLPNAFQEDTFRHIPFPRVMHTEIISENDPKAKLFDGAKRNEILGLLEKGAFKIVLREEAGDNPNIIPSRYVLAIKHSQNDSEPPKLKARFVLGGHRDRDRHSMVHDTNTVRPESIRLLIALSTIFGLGLSSVDWRQGYLQSESPLLRKVFIKPDILNLNQNELLQVILPIYGLPDAGEYWHDTLKNHLREHCRFKQVDTDLSLWFQLNGKKIIALAASYVDDLLLASTESVLKSFSKLSEQRFDITIDSKPNLSYLGMRIKTNPNGSREISQPKQIRRLRILSNDAIYAIFRSARASLAWLCQTRPDIACPVSMLARITIDTFDSTAIKAHNSIVKHLLSSADLSLKYPILDANTLRIVCYVDAGHHNHQDGHSQIGYVIVLADASDNASILAFNSRKSKRIVRPTTAGEGLALSAGYDAAFALRADLQVILSTRVPIILMTDSEILFNIITRRKTTSEKRMMIDLKIARAAYESKEISNLALISSQYNYADAMTKINPNSALMRLIETARLDHPITQYIIEYPLRDRVD